MRRAREPARVPMSPALSVSEVEGHRTREYRRDASRHRVNRLSEMMTGARRLDSLRQFSWPTQSVFKNSMRARLSHGNRYQPK